MTLEFIPAFEPVVSNEIMTPSLSFVASSALGSPAHAVLAKGVVARIMRAIPAIATAGA